MAKSKQKGPDLPEGFKPLTRKSVDGWYVVEEGNTVRGYYRGSFNVPSKFNRKDGKDVFKVELTEGGTKVVGPDGDEVELSIGDMVGIDKKGWLSALMDVDEGAEVFIRCTGKGQAKAGQSAPWMFDLGVLSDEKVPF